MLGVRRVTVGLKSSSVCARSFSSAAGKKGGYVPPSADHTEYGDPDAEPKGTFMDRLKAFFVFAPDSPVYETYVGKTKGAQGYRYPSPASYSKGKLTPFRNNTDENYNTQQYTRDNYAIADQQPFIVAGSPKVLSEMEKLQFPTVGQEQPEESSPGNKNPAVLAYDPTGTRSAMSATWDAMNTELEKVVPTHLPTQWHARAGVDLDAWCSDRNIPPRPGAPAKWTKIPTHGKW